MSETPSNDEQDLNKFLAELDKDKSSEEGTQSKKDKNSIKDKKNDEYNIYDYSDDMDLSDLDW